MRTDHNNFEKIRKEWLGIILLGGIRSRHTYWIESSRSETIVTHMSYATAVVGMRTLRALQNIGKYIGLPIRSPFHRCKFQWLKSAQRLLFCWAALSLNFAYRTASKQSFAEVGTDFATSLGLASLIIRCGTLQVKCLVERIGRKRTSSLWSAWNRQGMTSSRVHLQNFSLSAQKAKGSRRIFKLKRKSIDHKGR